MKIKIFERLHPYFKSKTQRKNLSFLEKEKNYLSI